MYILNVNTEGESKPNNTTSLSKVLRNVQQNYQEIPQHVLVFMCAHKCCLHLCKFTTLAELFVKLFPYQNHKYRIT